MATQTRSTPLSIPKCLIGITLSMVAAHSYALEPVCSRSDVVYCDDFEWSTSPGYVATPADWRAHNWTFDNVWVSDYAPGNGMTCTGAGVNNSCAIQYFLPAATGTSGTPYPDRRISTSGSGYNKIYARWYAKWSTGWVWDNIATKHFYVRGMSGGSMDWRVPIMFTQNGGMNVDIYESYACIPKELNLKQNQGKNIYFTGNELGKWHAIEMMVKLNTGSSMDGEVAVWVNGIKRLHYTGLQLRCPSSTTGINNIWVTSYWGGSGTESHPDQYVWYDNLVVSTNYIGPLSVRAGAPELLDARQF